MLPTLAELIAVVTPTNALSNILYIANSLGLTTTAWQPLGMARTILSTISQVVAGNTTYVNLIAQGGYATTASAMVDASGNPITTWMDLVSYENYNVTRNPAVAAEGVVGFANSTSVPHGPFSAGTLHLKHPLTGATYSNTLSTEQIYGNAGSSLPFDSYIHFVADVAGSASTATTGITLVLTTPIPGVSVLALGAGLSSTSLVGTDAETNSALLQRDFDKLGSISPNGAGAAIVYVATTASIIAMYGVVSAPVTRAQQVLNPYTGFVTVYIANAGGASTIGDAQIVQNAEQALAVPTGYTLTVTPASNLFIVVAVTIYVTGSAGTLSNDAKNAVVEYFASVPIGGLTASSAGIVPRSGILAAIQGASQFIREIVMPTPSGDVSVATGQVPVLDPSSSFVVVVVS